MASKSLPAPAKNELANEPGTLGYLMPISRQQTPDLPSQSFAEMLSGTEALYSSSISWSATWSAGRMVWAGSGLTSASCSIAVR